MGDVIHDGIEGPEIEPHELIDASGGPIVTGMLKGDWMLKEKIAPTDGMAIPTDLGRLRSNQKISGVLGVLIFRSI